MTTREQGTSQKHARTGEIEGISPVRLRSGGSSWGDLTLGLFSRGASVGIIAMLLALLFVVFLQAAPSMWANGLGFLTRTEWRANELERPAVDPQGNIIYEDGEMKMEKVPQTFGALPVIYGTAVSSTLALVIAMPLSFGAALFLVRLAPKLRIAWAVSFLVEFLAAIPSIAYGIWGLFVLAPFLAKHVEPAIKVVLMRVPGTHWMFFETVQVGTQTIERELPLTGRDMLCGSLVLAVMILPIITAVSRDVLKAVPRTQIEGTLALGATWWQSCWAMLHYSRSGLFGAVMLGLARAAGETMAVTMVIGNNMQVKASLFAPAQTMSSLLANEFAEAGDSGQDLHRSSLLYVAMILLVMSLLFNVVARMLVVGGSSRSSAAH